MVLIGALGAFRCHRLADPGPIWRVWPFSFDLLFFGVCVCVCVRLQLDSFFFFCCNFIVAIYFRPLSTRKDPLGTTKRVRRPMP